MKLETLQDLYTNELKDLYSAEQQITKALPKIIGKVESRELVSALEHHLEETRNHVARLDQVLEMHGVESKRQTCKGMEGILNEGDDVLGKAVPPPVRDAAIISACQRVEHYEMAAYGTVRTYAQQLGYERAAALLNQTLSEEAAADRKLTEIANGRVNIEAARTA